MEKFIVSLVFLFVLNTAFSQDTSGVKKDSVKSVVVKVPLTYKSDTTFYLISYIDSPYVKVIKAKIVVYGYGNQQLNGFYDGKPSTKILIGKDFNKEIKEEDVVGIIRKY